MIFTLGNLVVLAVVMAMFGLYHRITMNNRSLDKVKKLGDRLQRDLAEYADRRAEDLKTYGIELDVQQQAAKVALERLSAVQQAVAERAQSIGEIEKRLQEYDEILAKLVEMTARVDENLVRVQGQGEFAQTVNRRLDAARKSLDAVERELPLLRETFASDAERSLQAFRTEILEGLQGSVNDMTASLDSARKESAESLARAEKAAASIDATYEASFQRAGERASSLEDEAFRALMEATEVKAARLRDMVEERFAAVARDARGSAGALQENIAAASSELRALAGSIEALKASALQHLEGRLADYEADLFAGLAERRSGILQRLEAWSADLDARVEALTNEALERRASEEDAARDRLKAFEAEVDTRIRSIQDRVAARSAPTA